MIRLAESLDTLKALCKDSSFGCQIFSAAEAYGFEQHFAQFWTDEHAAYSKLDGVMRICGTVTDPEEAAAFIHAVGAEQVVCDLKTAEDLDLYIADRGVVLFKDIEEKENTLTEEVPLRAVYGVLHACDLVGAFEPFYLDVSHRVRHQTAFCTALYNENEMTAASVTVFGVDCALITAVAVLPKFRRQGLGTAVMRKTESRLSGRAYLLRAENENEQFYASLGYETCGVWCAGTLK